MTGYYQGKMSFADYRLKGIRGEIFRQMSAIAPTVPEWQPWTTWKDEPLEQETIKRILSDLRDAGITIDIPNPYETEEETQ